MRKKYEEGDKCFRNGDGFVENVRGPKFIPDVFEGGLYMGLHLIVNPHQGCYPSEAKLLSNIQSVNVEYFENGIVTTVKVVNKGDEFLAGSTVTALKIDPKFCVKKKADEGSDEQSNEESDSDWNAEDKTPAARRQVPRSEPGEEVKKGVKGGQHTRFT